MNPNQKNRPQSATQAAAGTPRPKSARRRSRELALQGLYEWLISRADVGVVMAHMREQDEHGRCDSAHLDALLQGCISQVAELDGVIAPFGEKYGGTVRVVTIPGISREFCGGTHMPQIGGIGLFAIVSEGAVSAGVRRIEAVTGEGALAYLQSLESTVNGVAGALKAAPGEVEARVGGLQE